MHIGCFTCQGVTVLPLLWAPNTVSTYVQLPVFTSLLAVQCTYVPVTENTTEHNACHVVEMEVNLMCQTTPQREASIQPWPTVGHVSSKIIQLSRTKHRPRPIAPHWHEPTQHFHYIVIDKKDNTCCMVRPLPSAHTPTDQVPLPTPILIIVLIYIYISSMINCIKPDDGHGSNGRNM